jgi:hypothetical protein
LHWPEHEGGNVLYYFQGQGMSTMNVPVQFPPLQPLVSILAVTLLCNLGLHDITTFPFSTPLFQNNVYFCKYCTVFRINCSQNLNLLDKDLITYYMPVVNEKKNAQT